MGNSQAAHGRKAPPETRSTFDELVALAKQAGAVALSATLVMRQLAPGVSTKPHQDTPTGIAIVLDPMLIADCDGVQWNWGGGMALLLRERVELLVEQAPHARVEERRQLVEHALLVHLEQGVGE